MEGGRVVGGVVGVVVGGVVGVVVGGVGRGLHLHIVVL